MKRNLSVMLGIIAVLLIGAVIWYQENSITVSVDLTPEQKQEYEVKLAEYSGKIETEVDPVDDLKRPNLDHFIEKARYEEYLGRLSDSVNTLKEAQKFYPVSTAIWNNIANVYERMGRYKKAIKYYSLLISELGRSQYYLDIARVARAAGNADLAQDAYWAYQMIHFRPDSEFEDWLRENAPVRDETPSKDLPKLLPVQNL